MWDVPYQWGAMVFGGLGPVDLRVAAMNSAPSSTTEAWSFDGERFEDPSWVFALRTRPSPYFDVGFSYRTLDGGAHGGNHPADTGLSATPGSFFQPTSRSRA